MATLANARTIVRSAGKIADTSVYDNECVDDGIQAAGDEYARKTRAIRAVDETLSLTSAISQLSLSGITNFNPERLTRVEITYPDMGVWAVGSAYAVNDMVIGDGDPDAYYYRVTGSHTSAASAEPPNTLYWTKLQWKSGFDVTHTDYDRVAAFLNERGADPSVYSSVDSVDTGRPRYCGFRDDTTAFFWPVPNANYGVRLTFWQNFTRLSTGGSGTETLNIPTEDLYAVLWWGALHYITFRDPRMSWNEQAKSRWDAFLSHRMGTVGIDSGVFVKNEAQYI